MAEPGTQERLTLDELVARIRAVDPRALGVPSRRLRRIIRLSRRLGGLLVQVPHRKTLCTRREQLDGIAEPDELGLLEHEAIPARVMLVALPTRKDLEQQSPAKILLGVWRLLLHQRVHLELETAADRGDFTQAAVRERVDRIGQTAFDEIRAVLRQENLLLPPISDLAVYIEFAAVFFELYHFDRELLSRMFPSIDGLERVAHVLGQDLDIDEHLQGTRPEGAPDPGSYARVERVETQPGEPALVTLRSQKKAARLLARADVKERRGNLVRSAILRTRARTLLDPLKARKASEAAARSLRQLVRRLQTALGAPRAVAPRWARALEPLLESAGTERWAHSGRLLYDLQKVCIDHEQGVSAVSLIRWIMSFGRQPLRRSLPHQREVLMSRHLHSATRRLKRLSLGKRDRESLEELLREAADQAALVVRERLRPLIRHALHDVGLNAENTPEVVARDKIIEEMLDRIVAHGYLSVGHLRDTVSRNRLKLCDVPGPLKWVQGDALLRADKRLARELDGVYRRGEIYLQALLRFSSLVFGTKVGRFFTLYLAMPIGGAYVLLEGIQHMVVELLAKLLNEDPIHVATPWSIGTLSLYLFGMIHALEFRKISLDWFRKLWSVVRGSLYDYPRKLINHPRLRRFLQSEGVLLAWRFLVKPSLWSGLFCLPLLVSGLHGAQVLVVGGSLFVLVNFFLASRISGELEELSTDWSTRLWLTIRTHLILGMFRLLVDVFRVVLETIDRALYTVDEWLRFRSEQGRGALLLKAATGVVWGVLAWAARFIVIVLLEPQINPIKHFPVVTVSHKLMIPALPKIVAILSFPLAFLGEAWAAAVATGITFILPGAFGFLVWEFKENWKLFRANSPRHLKALPIGGHGETMLRFMKPGFHSGTLPKAYAKLSRSIRRAHQGEPWGDPKTYRAKIHHVEEDVYRFVEREFVALLNRHRPTRGLPIQVAAVHTASNRIRVELTAEPLYSAPCLLDFEEQSGWLVASLPQPGWMLALGESQAVAVRNALLGLYQLAGVRLVREQINAQLGGEAVAYDISIEGLVVWPGPGYVNEAVYSLSLRASGEAVKRGAGPFERLPKLHVSELALSMNPCLWDQWLSVWEEPEGAAPPPAILPAYRVIKAAE